ncbi:PRC-barrel domain-containing protein [Paraburkholderia sp. MPAMCS5]|uniref:PRC-barrel domain-containing protein n=1 Tax=Paraburkholderia sp. MPAMCS5 TaxID=3112563 RepID=UPI002E18FD4F|nr:PRC-barrel domain-containing protein [Paraburkholderia sp. MPAMCS5]
MLRSTKDLEDYAIGATDGVIGHVKDFYFDDEAWVIRYLVVDTGSWLSSRRVLISPIALGQPSWTDKVLPVSITKEQVKNSPDIDTQKPVSRQHEIQYLGYYGYPYYWGGAGLWGNGLYPNTIATGFAGYVSMPQAMRSEGQPASARVEAAHEDDDAHLRSCKAVMGRHIEATDGDIGHVQALLVDEETWAIRYIIVNTSNWWLGHDVLIAPQWIQDMNWPGETVSVNLTRQAVKDAPPYDPAAQLDRTQEMAIHEHYGRPGYWANEATHDAAIPGARQDGLPR